MSLSRFFMLIAASLLLSARMVFGMAGELSSPSIAMPENCPVAKAALAVLMDKQYKFLHGRFINSSTTLEYDGDAASLNSLIARLTQCGATVNVQFDQGDTPFSIQSDAAWTLNHIGVGAPETFGIVVNAKRISEASVQIPAKKQGSAK